VKKTARMETILTSLQELEPMAFNRGPTYRNDRAKGHIQLKQSGQIFFHCLHGTSVSFLASCGPFFTDPLHSVSVTHKLPTLIQNGGEC
jgi:hypothetical protein